MKQVFGYIRVSTPRQGERGVSLQEQREAITRYCARHELGIARWFEERETAAKSGRKQFNEMLKLLRQKTVAGLVIHKIDRSARNLKDWANLGELIDDGIEVHFANESLDLNSRGGRLSADIQAVVAADFIRNLREETRKGFYGRLKQGLYPRRAPIGYVDNGGGKPKTPHPVMGSLVRAAFELYASGRYSLPLLVERLDELGLRNRSGNPVSLNGLATLLKNPFYMGLVRLARTGESFAGVHEPLISRTLYDQVQAVFRGKPAPKVQRHDFTYRKLFKCQHCGYSLIGECQKGVNYYRCHTKTCPVTCLPEENIEDSLLCEFSLLRFTDEERRALQEELVAMKEGWSQQQEKMIAGLKLTLSGIDDRMNRLTDAVVDGLLDKPAFQQRKQALLLERLSAEEKLTTLETNYGSVPSMLESFLEQADLAYLSYKAAFKDEKRDLLLSLTSNRTVGGKKVCVKLNLPFKIIAERQNLPVGSTTRSRPRTLIAQLSDTLVQVPSENTIDDNYWRRYVHKLSKSSA